MKVKISVEEQIQQQVGTPQPALGQANQDFGNDDIVSRPIVKNDAEAWVSRIMHPLLDADTAAWCPEYWHCGQKQLKLDQQEFPDDATIASTTSSKLNDVSSITPFLPDRATSSDINDDENKEKKSTRGKKEKCGRRREMSNILGIIDQQHMENHPDERYVRDEVSRKRYLARTPSPPPPSDGWGYDTSSSNLATSLPSSWRPQPWETFDAKSHVDVDDTKDSREPEDEGHGVDKEFDVEGVSDFDFIYSGLGLSGRLAEI